MESAGVPPRASYGLSVLVALGWYATVTAAVLVGQSGLPAAPDRDCSGMFSCMTPLETAGLLAVVLGIPVFGGLLASTLLITRLLARRVTSSILAGTLTALASVGVVGVVGAVWHGAR